MILPYQYPNFGQYFMILDLGLASRSNYRSPRDITQSNTVSKGNVLIMYTQASYMCPRGRTILGPSKNAARDSCHPERYQ
jgi:hypothetical protein